MDVVTKTKNAVNYKKLRKASKENINLFKKKVKLFKINHDKHVSIKQTRKNNNNNSEV